MPFQSLSTSIDSKSRNSLFLLNNVIEKNPTSETQKVVPLLASLNTIQMILDIQKGVNVL